MKKNVGTAPVGAAATRADRGLRFRNTFLGTVAASALSLAFGGPGTGAVDRMPARSIRRRHQSRPAAAINHAGIAINAPTAITTLNVNNLTQAIAPAIIGPPGTPGITFSSAGAITINSNTGAFGITTGNNENGIYANASSGNPDGNVDRQHYHRGRLRDGD